CDLIGLGLTSIGYVGGNFFQNAKEMDDYQAAIESSHFAIFRGYQLTQEDHLRRHVIMRLMCDFSLDYKFFEANYNIDFKTHFSDALEGLTVMQDDCLVALNEDGMQVLTAGRLLIRNIAMAFDEHLRVKPGESKFSKVI
ncbi:MAG: coproporphyrinogen III oxidase, partial [Mariprofundaceae bacterium]|nr:coproporphyrinogen III oxidase [Mariprofundaceae bacterium]